MKQSLSQILHNLLNRTIQNDSTRNNDLTDTLLNICHSLADNNVIEFSLGEHSTNAAMKKAEVGLGDTCPNYASFAQSVSYLLDELTCNMQQHS
ncbi:MAG: hypothetical protein MJZ89_06120, partial [Paludibacteraceae bacterium]|nr:hypothetical protein [Paludibacteraceae bacterium]